MKDIENDVKRIIAEQLGIDKSEIKIDSSFTNDLDIDSLNMVEIIMALEEHFECDIDDEDAGEIDSIEQIINYIKSKENDKSN